MSFPRFVFYCAIVGGWAAFAGWLLSEAIFMRRSQVPDELPLVLTFALVGASIGGGLNLLAGAVHGTLMQNLPRLWVGLVGGLIGGAAGGLVGNLFYTLLPKVPVLPRALGWVLIGMGIGCVEGIYDRSWNKIRNGLIGGGLGGFLGGLLFEPVLWLIGGNADQEVRGIMSSRATAFVILGLCIGLLVGLAQVILREAWLTVEEGFRPGRQVTLGRAETILGTSEKAQLPFIAYGAKGVEPIHLRILRQPDGHYILEDNNSRTGTLLNRGRVEGPVALTNGDLIQLGPNSVRYSERFRQVLTDEAKAPATAARPAEAKQPGTPRGTRPAARPAPGKPGPPRLGKVEPPPLPGRKADAPARQAPPARPSPAPGGFAPASKPAPPPVAPRPAPPPLPPSPDLDQVPIISETEMDRANATDDACPICGRQIKGAVGKRLCDNCGIKF